MSVLKDFAGKYADVKSESDYGHMKMEAAFIAGAEWIAQNIRSRIMFAELNGQQLPATMVNNFFDDLMNENIRVYIPKQQEHTEQEFIPLEQIKQGTTPLDIKETVHVDFADNIPYTEVENGMPNAYKQYSDYPINCYMSEMCTVITKTGERKIAVYAMAWAVHPNNDGKHCQWDGWVEWYESETCAYVENLFEGKTLDVVRWHYLKY